MITVKAFVGALLDEVAQARVLSDQASLHVAQRYLDNDLLRGFPVPRMQISTIDLELNFAVASRLDGPSFLDDEEVQRNVGYQLRELLHSLPGRPEFHAYFGKDVELAARWRNGLGEMTTRFVKVLARPSTEVAGVVRALSLSAQNYFCESAPEELRHKVSALLGQAMDGYKAEGADSMKAIVEREIVAILSALDKSVKEEAAGGPPDLNVLIGAAELEKLNPGLLHRVKITVSPSDRRWVATEQDGKKIYILDRA